MTRLATAIFPSIIHERFKKKVSKQWLIINYSSRSGPILNAADQLPVKKN